jgi:hypothetical protein
MELGETEPEEDKEGFYFPLMDLFPMPPYPYTPWENGPDLPGFHHEPENGMLDNGVGDRFDLSYIGHHLVSDSQAPPFTSVSELDCSRSV